MTRTKSVPSPDIVRRPKKAIVKLPPVQIRTRTTSATLSPAVKPSDVEPVRIPSPLLYHQRGSEVTTEPLYEPYQPLGVENESVIDKYSSKHTHLMSEIRAVKQQPQPTVAVDTTVSRFVASKLPLMGDAIVSEDSEEGGVNLVGDNTSFMVEKAPQSTSFCLTPIPTTTNTYIFPKKVFHIYAGQANLAWSGPSCNNVSTSWTSSQSTRFPQSTSPKRTALCNLKASSNSSNQDLMLLSIASSKHTKKSHIWQSLPVAGIRFALSSRDSSSTNDSLDSCFNIATATTQRSLPNDTENMLRTPQASPSTQSHTKSGSRDEQQTTDLGRLYDHTSRGENGPKISETVEWLFSDLALLDCQSPTQGHGSSCPSSEDFGDYKIPVSPMLEANSVPIANAVQPDKVWFDYHAPHGFTDDEATSGTEVDVEDPWIEAYDSDWDDDTWETATSSSVDDVQSQMGLDGTE